MSAPTNTVVTYSAIGNREDLVDTIYNVSPTDTPFQANIVSGTTGALLTLPAAVGGSGTLTAIVMTAFGANYLGSDTHAITFGGVSLGAAAATAIMSFCAIAALGGTVTATGGAAQITNTPAITSLGIVGSGLNDNNSFFPRPMRGLVTAAANGTFILEDPGFGLQGAAVFVNGGTSTTVATVTNTQYGGRSDSSVLQAMVQ